VRLPGKHGHRVVATVGDSNVTKPVGAEVADAHGHRLMADADGPADGEAVTGVAAHDEQPIAGAVGHEQTDSVVRGPFGYRTRLHPVAERDRHRRTQIAAEPEADETQAAWDAGKPAGEERPQRRDRPADVNSRRWRGERHRTHAAPGITAAAPASATARADRNNGASLSPNEGAR